jgi:uncharacterized membrane protein YbhN (UPF0104 family)
MQNLKTALKSIWWALILIFVTLFLYKNLNTAAEVIDKLPFVTILTSFSAIVIAKFFLALIMHLALLRYAINLTYPRCFSIYNITQLGKYIPGSIWQFVGRITLYREADISNDKIRDTLLLETFWVVFSALSIGLILILLIQYELIGQLLAQSPVIFTNPFLYAVLAVTLITLLVFWRPTLIRYIRQFMFNTNAAATVLALWACLGFSFWITLLPISSQDISLIYIIGLYALSYALGFMVPFAPAGIGIREAILVMGLAPYIETNTAIVLATINRLFYIMSEILLVLIATRKTGRKSKEDLSL